MEFRIGQGIDIHPFAEGRKCILGGIEIPFDQGLLGHSDADALVHALIDAILGAVGESDIGTIFPDSDEQWKGADSCVLLERVWELVTKKGWRLNNADVTVLAQVPRIAPFVAPMRQKLSAILNVESELLAIKATTTEKLGFVGRQEGILATAVVLLVRG